MDHCSVSWEIWSFVSKMTRIWWNLSEDLQVSKTCTFICSYWAKYLKFEIKKYRGVIFHDTEGWCKIWGKTDLWFGKWHEKSGKFSPEHLKVSKLGFWFDPLIQSRKIMSFKSIEELCHDNEEWCRIWRGIDLSFQNWHEEFDKYA